MNPGSFGSSSFVLHLPATGDSVSAARHSLEDLPGIPAATLDDLKLLVSELVTNSVRHTGLQLGDLIELRVSGEPGRVRVEVADQGPGFKPQPPPRASSRESGWGLFLVEQISSRWGLAVDGETRVWFELDFPSANGRTNLGPTRL